MFGVFLMSIVYFPGISVYLDCIYHVIMCSGNSLDQQVWGNLLSLYLPQCFLCGLSVQWIMLMWNCELLLFGVRYLTEKKKFSLDMRWPTLFRNSINIVLPFSLEQQVLLSLDCFIRASVVLVESEALKLRIAADRINYGQWRKNESVFSCGELRDSIKLLSVAPLFARCHHSRQTFYSGCPLSHNTRGTCVSFCI